MNESPKRNPWLARLRVDRWLIGICLLAALLAAATALNYTNSQLQQDNARWVAHTHEVIDILTSVKAHPRLVACRASMVIDPAPIKLNQAA